MTIRHLIIGILLAGSCSAFGGTVHFSQALGSIPYGFTIDDTQLTIAFDPVTITETSRTLIGGSGVSTEYLPGLPLRPVSISYNITLTDLQFSGPVSIAGFQRDLELPSFPFTTAGIVGALPSSDLISSPTTATFSGAWSVAGPTQSFSGTYTRVLTLAPRALNWFDSIDLGGYPNTVNLNGFPYLFFEPNSLEGPLFSGVVDGRDFSLSGAAALSVFGDGQYIATVPVPTAAWLFPAALSALAARARRRRRHARLV
jgi:hypothetical protein